MHCQVPGIDYSLSKLAIHAALESATAIALSHTGILYIAETDEKKINRVRQVGAAEILNIVVSLSGCFAMNLPLERYFWRFLLTAQLVRLCQWWFFSFFFSSLSY